MWEFNDYAGDEQMAKLRGLRIAFLLVTVSILALAGCSSGSKGTSNGQSSQEATAGSSSLNAPQTGHAVVNITDNGFEPATVTVLAGTKVIWTNEGKLSHDVTPDAGGPSSGTIKPGVTATHMFPQQGTFHYHDRLHPQLKGVVVVQ